MIHKSGKFWCAFARVFVLQLMHFKVLLLTLAWSYYFFFHFFFPNLHFPHPSFPSQTAPQPLDNRQQGWLVDLVACKTCTLLIPAWPYLTKSSLSAAWWMEWLGADQSFLALVSNGVNNIMNWMYFGWPNLGWIYLVWQIIFFNTLLFIIFFSEIKKGLPYEIKSHIKLL